jgi:hypothetical protein
MDSADVDASVEAAAAPEHRRPWWAPLTIVAFVGLVICTNVANAVWARWVDSNPEALLALSSRQRYLALSVPGGIGVVPYIAIGTVRLAAAFVVCHLAGRVYRDDLLRLFTRYLGLTPEALDAYHQALDRAEIVVIPFFVGSNIVAVLTGIRRTAPLRLGVLLAIGIAARLALIWWLAKVFEEPLVDVLGWVQRYQWWFVIVSVILVIAINARNYVRGSRQ